MTQIQYDFENGEWNRTIAPDAPDFYLVGEKTQEYVRLGIKLPHRYQGPSVWRADGSYFLSERILSLLIGRFYLKNEFAFVKFMDFYAFDHSNSQENSFEEFKEVGGERDNDIPLRAYLPELQGMKVEDYTVKATKEFT